MQHLSGYVKNLLFMRHLLAKNITLSPERIHIVMLDRLQNRFLFSVTFLFPFFMRVCKSACNVHDDQLNSCIICVNETGKFRIVTKYLNFGGSHHSDIQLNAKGEVARVSRVIP